VARVSIYCPHCQRHTSLEPAPTKTEIEGRRYTVAAIWRPDDYEAWWIGLCNYCGRAVLVQGEGHTVYPTALPSPTDKNIPDAIRSDLNEAKKCDTISAWPGCAVMARRAIQSAAIERGASGSKLVDQVADLASKGVITQDLKEWADVVRWVGNDAAHPGGQAVTQQDAEDILKLAEQFLHVIYVARPPSRRRAAKSVGSDGLGSHIRASERRVTGRCSEAGGVPPRAASRSPRAG